jgi:hypothetical protein
MELLLLILLGLITYFIVKRSVVGITRTPVWLLWLVMMTPALVWSAWNQFYSDDTPMPLAVVFGPFAVCLPLYWLLIQWGRRDFSPPESKGTETTTQNPALSKTVPPVTEESTLRPISKQEETELRNCFPWGCTISRMLSTDPKPFCVVVSCAQTRRPHTRLCGKILRQNLAIAFS